MADNVQHIRLRRPDTEPKPKQPPETHRNPSRPAAQGSTFSLAVRILLLVRFTGAMYSNIDDCDEVFNFWEPLAFPRLRLRISNMGSLSSVCHPELGVHQSSTSSPAKLSKLLLTGDKRAAFFAVRISLATASVFAEAKFYRTVYEKINERVGRYLFFMLLFSAGMWNASAALLPSSFAMYMSTFAFSYALAPSSAQSNRRTLAATLLFATGAIVGWPFALALSVPFVFEELFIFSADRVAPEIRMTWMLNRWKRLFSAGLTASLIFIPVIAIDSIAYGKLAIVPWNIIKYNVFGGADRGPDLYGTSPWNFYFLNLTLNFNVTYFSVDQSSPFTVLALRLAPFYLWTLILTSQAHKEERFMFPAYPLLCFNAAVTLYLMRGWLETIFISLTKSPYRASQSTIFRTFTSSVVVASAVLSVSRVLAQTFYYHSPLSVVYAFQTEELPRLLNDTGLLPIYPPGTAEEDIPRIDLSPVKDFNLTMCVSKEWYRFPGHYLVPFGVRVDFVKSEFDGLLPWAFRWSRPETRNVPVGLNDLNREQPSYYASIEACDYMLDLDFPKHPSSSTLEPRYAVDATKWERVFCTPFLDARHSNLLTRTLWLPGQAWQSLNEFGDYCLLKNRDLGCKEGGSGEDT
ncbi:glycosyltransferase family 22 protein [Mycena alexandri]|uniref:Mannosyltransferase n=1 Tax=Mycena alexandri TaxID=1745969 RepID=A0AAD6TAG3_9AGAR|nr:glycosyltransferase family 22 protein [Mycena alexandri]